MIVSKGRRDLYFDVFKGVMILSVINIHTVYWSLKAHTPDLFRELAYFVDIPIFFFISGYFSRYATFTESLSQALGQLVRLYRGYLAVTGVVACATLLWVFIFKERIPDGLLSSLLSIFTLQLTGELWGYFKGYYGNLWYLHTYFPLLLLVPFLLGTPLYPRIRILIMTLLLTGYWLMTYHFKGHIFLLREWGDVLFYGFIFVLGSSYRIKENRLSPGLVLTSFAINVMIVLFIIYVDDGTLRLSRYKFPPSFQWLAYSTLLIHLFVLLRPLWNSSIYPLIKFFVPLLAWIGNHSFTVYLFQGLVCSIPYLFVSHLAEPLSSSFLLYLVVYGFNVLLSILISKIYVISADAIKSRGFLRQGRRRSGS